MNLKLDTGAEAKIPTRVLERLGLTEHIECSKKRSCSLCSSYVVDFNKAYGPLLVLQSCEEFDLVRRNVYDNRKFDVFTEYKNLFKGLEEIKTESCNIKLNKDAIPRVVTCRKIPFKLRKRSGWIRTNV